MSTETINAPIEAAVSYLGFDTHKNQGVFYITPNSLITLSKLFPKYHTISGGGAVVKNYSFKANPNNFVWQLLLIAGELCEVDENKRVQLLVAEHKHLMLTRYHTRRWAPCNYLPIEIPTEGTKEENDKNYLDAVARRSCINGNTLHKNRSSNSTIYVNRSSELGGGKLYTAKSFTKDLSVFTPSFTRLRVTVPAYKNKTIPIRELTWSIKNGICTVIGTALRPTQNGSPIVVTVAKFQTPPMEAVESEFDTQCLDVQMHNLKY